MSQQLETDSSLSLSRPFFFTGLVLALSAGLIGFLWNLRPHLSPNDNSRWDTVWSLVEYGTYQIFDTDEDANKAGVPKQLLTIDKIVKDGKTYSTKPPLYPTVIAGYVYGLKQIFRHPFSIDTRTADGKEVRGSIRIYGRAVLFLFNVAPFIVSLVLYRRYLDRVATNPWTWTLCLLFAAVGTLVTGYLSTLNNHTMAAAFALVTLYLAHGIVFDPAKRSLWRFALTGLAATWTAANELPAGALVVFVGCTLACIDFKKTLFGFVPPAILVTAAFFYTNWLAVGSLIPAYLQPQLKDHEGGYWNDVSKMSPIDALNVHPEPKWLYAINMLFGHHGVFSHTPVWIFAVAGWWLTLFDTDRRQRVFACLAALLSTIVFCFYLFVSSERNYGGFCHGMRWLLWLTPFWLYFLPRGVDSLVHSKWGLRIFALCFVVSVISVTDTIVLPWTYSWIHHVLRYTGVSPY